MDFQGRTKESYTKFLIDGQIDGSAVPWHDMLNGHVKIFVSDAFNAVVIVIVAALSVAVVVVTG